MAEVDDKELDALRKSAEDLKALEGSIPKAEFDQKVKDWETEKARLEQEAHPNWKVARKQIEDLTEIAKKKGVEFNEDGSPKIEDKMSREDVEKAAQETTRKELLNGRLDELLENYNDEEAKVVRRQYEKLTAGEEVNMKNIRSFVVAAEGASGFSGPSKINRAMQGGGQGPRIVEKNDDKLEDSVADEVAGMMGIKISKSK